ncbi:MAG: T9SS type A sorting domain-containing protein [Bacteroidota bacterium]
MKTKSTSTNNMKNSLTKITNIRGLRFLVLIFMLTLTSGSVFSTNYYWVGGTGSWTMLNHWATTSGGTTMHTTLPDMYDDVYFDNHSFPTGGTITVNGTPVCNDLNFTGVTGTPTLAGYNLLKIYGSLTLATAMNITYIGSIYFESTMPGCTINTKGKTLLSHVYFNGVGGEWTLADSLSLGNNKSVYLYNGSLITNNKNISCYKFSSDRIFPRSLILGSSIIRIHDNTSSAMAIYLEDLWFDAGSSSIRFLGQTGPTGGGLYISDQNLGLTADFNNVMFGYPNGASTLNISLKSICSFNQLTFLGDGIINGSNTYNNLILTPGKSYTLQSRKKQTINGTLSATGGCSGYISIQSSIAGTVDTIYKSSGTVTLAKCILRDICKSGAAAFTASSSIDLGNNSGWSFTAPSSTTYYWVGGTGNWESPAHWSLTSGGAGGSCIPGPADNVIFNASSFNGAGQSVTVSGTLACCKNMTWTGVNNSPTFAGASTAILKVFGSLNMNANFNFGFTGNVHFAAATTGNTISCGDKTINGDIYFLSSGGWGLSDSLILASGKSIFLYTGSLATNGYKVSCTKLISDLTGNRGLSFGSSEIVLSSTLLSGAMVLNMTNLVFDGGTSLLRFTGTSGINAGGFTISGTNAAPTNLYDVVLSSAGASSSIYVLTAGGAAFHDVIFQGSGSIYGKNTYHDLTFTSGSSYFLQAGKTQTITGNWNASGNCSSYIIVQSNTFASPASVIKTTGTVSTDYILLRDIQVSGGAAFSATNATNMGGNSGWTFSAPVSRTYYWISGSGSWSNQSHWSLNSGGTPAACLPGPNDNVVFDANSFLGSGSIVTIDPVPAYCKNMIWNHPLNNPTFGGTAASTIRIFGSLNLYTGMVYNYKGKLYFESGDTTNVINTSGKTITSDMYFQGTGGWTLADSLKTGPTNSIFYYMGAFNTANYNITALRFTSDKTTNRKLKLGSSTLTLSGAGGVPAIYLNTVNLAVNAGTSRIVLPNYSGVTAGIVCLVNGLPNSTIQLYDVVFSATTGTASISTNGQLTASFHKVTMGGSGKILGNNYFETLLFAPGKKYTLQSTKTQTITSYWGFSGQCSIPDTIISSITGNPAKVSKVSGIVSGFNIVMSDISALGGATFNAFNSTDLGGNTGWNFTTQGTLGNPGIISGQANVCVGQTATYSVNAIPGVVSYNWTLPSGVSLVTGQGTNLITVVIGNITTATISVNAYNGCITSTSSSKTLTVFTIGFNAVPPVCQNATPFTLTTGTPAGGTYFGNGVTGSQFNPATAGIGTHNIGYVYNTGGCIDTAFQTVNVMGAPSTPSQPTGQTVVCQGSSNIQYATTVVGSAIVNWSITPAGAGTITGTGITSIVNWNPGFAGVAVISATASTSCGTSAASSVNIIVGQGPTAPAPITGPVSVCQGTPASTFGTSSYANTGFIWSISPVQAGVINGVDSTINVLWNPAFSGNAIITAAAYNSCDTTASVNFTIHVDTLVAQLIFHNGQGTVCQGTDSVHYGASCYNASGYFWTLNPSNAGQLLQSGSHAIVNWDSTFTGLATILVYAYNNCDTTSPVSMQVSVLPGPPHPTVTLAGYLLTSSTAPSYQWLLNGQPIQGETNQYCTASATGYYSVVVANTYGCNDTSDLIFIDYITGISDMPGTGFGAEVNPNPMTDGGQIVLNLNKQARVNIELIDVTGRILVRLIDGIDTPAGRNSFIITKEQLDTYHGVYYFKVSAGEQTKILPVVIMD